MTKFADLADRSEDSRIQIIGETATIEKLVVGFIVEDNAKADRYVEKLKKQFPTIHIIQRGKGPVAGSVMVQVGPQPN